MTDEVTMAESIEPEVRTWLENFVPPARGYTAADIFDIPAVVAGIADLELDNWARTGRVIPVDEFTEDEVGPILDEHAFLPWAFCERCNPLIDGYDPCSSHYDRYVAMYGTRSVKP